MNITIWKYKLSDTSCVITVPLGAELLSVQLQYNEPVAWFKVNPEETAKTTVGFKLLFTGHFYDIDSDYKFVNTLQYHDGNLIVHVFSTSN